MIIVKMKRILLLCFTAICCSLAGAQEPDGQVKGTAIVAGQPETQPQAVHENDGDNAAQGLMQFAPDEYGHRFFNPYSMDADSLHLPPFTSDGRVIVGRYPFYRYGWGGIGTWDLHRGLNVSLGASVFSQFGRHAHHGAGFAQNVSALYAEPLTDKLSVAIGAYFNNVYWGRTEGRDAGVTGVMSYRFDDHWEAFLYGQKSFVNDRIIPYPLYDIEALGDRIGASVIYNFSPSFSLGVSVERHSQVR